MPKDPSCPEESLERECDPEATYRTFSGQCNNLGDPDNGKHTRTLTRILPPEYDDGVSRPRGKNKLTRRPLPNVRTVSHVVHAEKMTPVDAK